MPHPRLSDLFRQMADVLDILGQDGFRSRAYRRAARALDGLSGDLTSSLADGSLARLPGIGKTLLAHCREYVETGRLAAHVELTDRLPASVLRLLQVPGMGPKAVGAVYTQLGVTDRRTLREALECGRVVALPGFGPGKVAALRRGLDFLDEAADRLRIDQALDVAATVLAHLRACPAVEEAQAVGSLRRGRETVRDVDLLAVVGPEADPHTVVRHLVTADFVADTPCQDADHAIVRVLSPETPVPVHLHVTTPLRAGLARILTTGSAAHREALCARASACGLRLADTGLFGPGPGHAPLETPSEAAVYRRLGLAEIPPALRENRGEIESAASGGLPRVVEERDIRGDLHLHTRASDGHCEIADLAARAIARGYAYICITDHSQSSAIARGLDAARLREQMAAVRRFDAGCSELTVLTGSEVDIGPDGRLDFDDALLADLDYVVASIHQGLNNRREQLMQRLFRAMDSPHVDCIGHPTGRLLGRRPPMDLDMNALIQHAAETGTALEVNGNPYRLDLRDEDCRQAVEAGVKLVLATDSHRAEGLDMMCFAVRTATRGWVPPHMVVNTGELGCLRRWLGR